MSSSNQQTLAESGATDRPPILEMYSITKGPYVRPMITNLDDPHTIPNDIYNSVDACKNAQKMWERIRRLMYGSEKNKHVIHSRLLNEFDKFEAKEGESLESVYESPSYSHSPQPYYVTHPSSVVDYEEDYQRESQRDAQEDKLSTAMMNAGRQNMNQVANAGNGQVQQIDESNQIVQHVPLTESSLGRANVQCYNCNARGHYARDCPKHKVRDAKYFREQMLLAMKDEARGTLNDEENDFMLDNSYGDETLKELIAVVFMMVRIQPTYDNAETEPKYDAEAVSEVNASYINLISGMLSKSVHEHTNHEKRKTIINASDDDQIDSNIIFDDPYVENNGQIVKHASNAHDQSFDIESLVYNVQREAENQQRLNIELEKKKELLQKELETCKERLAKKAFKARENSYLEDIVDLNDKLSSHDRIVYKMGPSIQTIHMLGKRPKKIYDPFLKAGLGYQNPERLKKAIAAQPKMYDGERLHSTKLIIDSLDSEETLEDAEESQLKMKNKIIQLNYAKLNALYETFIHQKEISAEQTYFSTPSTSNVSSESSKEISDLPTPKMPNEMSLVGLASDHGINEYVLVPLVNMDDPNITMEEYIRLEEEKARRRGQEFLAIIYKDALTSEQEISSEPTISYFNDSDYFKDFEKEFLAITCNEKALSRGETFNWKTDTYGKMEYYEDEDDCFTNFESEFPAIVLDNTITPREALSREPT
ncbi:putative ribonuclease H-like domain-containing protein, partial [Tanacetum coccineum]